MSDSRKNGAHQAGNVRKGAHTTFTTVEAQGDAAVFRLHSRKASRTSFIMSLVLHGVGAIVLSIIVVSQRAQLGAIFSTELIELPKQKPQIVKRRMAPRPPSAPRATTVKAMPSAQNVPVTPLPVAAFSMPVAGGFGASSRLAPIPQTVAAPPPALPTRFLEAKPMIAAPEMMAFPTVAISERFDVKPFQPTTGLTTFLSSVASDRRLTDPLEELKTEIKRRVQSAQKYPRLAQANGVEGSTRVEFTIHRDGTLEAVSVARPSGSSVLDAAAVAAVRDAAPYPALPESQRGDRAQFNLDIVFRLVAN